MTPATASLLVLAVPAADLLASLALPPPPPLYRRHPRLGWTLRPGLRRPLELRAGDRVVWSNLLRANAAGFHDEEWPAEKRPGVRRVLVVGDSYVEARQVPREGHLAGRARRLLDERAPGRWEVLSAGVAGWGVDNALNLVEEVGPEIRPDHVVAVPFLGNDLVEGDADACREIFGLAADPRRWPKPAYVREEGGLRKVPPSPARLDALADLLDRRSRLWRFALERLDRHSGNARMKRRGVSYNAYMRDHKGLDHYRSLLVLQAERLRDVCAGLGARLSVLLLPNHVVFEAAGGADRPEEAAIDREHYAVVLDRLRASSIDVRPLGDVLRAEEAAGRPVTFGRWDHHLGPHGHEVAARLVVETVAG